MEIMWVIGALFVLAIVFSALSFYAVRRRKRETNHRAIFILGIFWIMAGIFIENFSLGLIGFIFLLVGFIKKKEWGKKKKHWIHMTREEKKMQIIYFVMFLILFLIGVVAYVLLG